MRPHAVYILTNRSGTLYVGMTDDLAARLGEHRSRERPHAFSARYALDRLVYVEYFESGGEASARELQLKRWSRAKKVGLIERLNPRWQDLSLDHTGAEAVQRGSPQRWARGARRGVPED
jgi:putative endonuclease